MKIDINKIPLEGLIFEEQVNPAALDLNTDYVKIPLPLKIRAEVSRITNAITVVLNFNASLSFVCSRCLEEFKSDLERELTLNYQVNKTESIIDLDQDIKEEIILDYPIKPLCKTDCKGLCPKCGKNLNEGGCSCATT